MGKVHYFLLRNESENNVGSPQKYGQRCRSLREMRTLVRIFHFKNPLTFYSLADFFVGRTAYCTQLYVET